MILDINMKKILDFKGKKHSNHHKYLNDHNLQQNANISIFINSIYPKIATYISHYTPIRLSEGEDSIKTNFNKQIHNNFRKY